jgi:hypothetical protein
MCLVLVGSGEAKAQDADALQPGEAYVTRFSGTSVVDGKPVIDIKGTVGSIVDVRNPSQPPQGQHWLNEPQRHPVSAGEIGQVFGVALDDETSPNVYVTATSAFGLHRTPDNADWMAGMWASVYAQVRDRLFSMKNRMSFLEAHASDPTVASAILTAPLFLSGLSDAEVAMVRLKVEQHIAPEIIEARDATAKAMQEVEEGWQRAQDVIGATCRSGQRRPMAHGMMLLCQRRLNNPRFVGESTFDECWRRIAQSMETQRSSLAECTQKGQSR